MARECKWEPEREPLPAAISDAWWAWYRGEITFARYLELAMAAQAKAAADPTELELE